MRIYLLILHVAFTMTTELEDCVNDLKLNERFIFDFTTISNLDNWIESSDTVREPGMSKAAFTLQKSKLFQRGVFFSLLNPQPNGAGFAGVNYHGAWDLSDWNAISLKLRGQGSNQWYKIVLRHKNQNQEPYPTYEQTFQTQNEFTIVNLPLLNFLPFYRGKPLNESDVGKLDLKSISSIGIQIYGGVYLPIKQSGVSSLEIDWIKAIDQ